MNGWYRTGYGHQLKYHIRSSSLKIFYLLFTRPNPTYPHTSPTNSIIRGNQEKEKPEPQVGVSREQQKYDIMTEL